MSHYEMLTSILAFFAGRRGRPGLAAHRRSSGLRLQADHLEERSLPSGMNYLPPSYFFSDQPSMPLSSPVKGEPLAIAKSYLTAHASDFHLLPADLTEAIVTSQYTDTDSGTTHIYLRQTVNGLPVNSADLNIAIAADGHVRSAGGGFVTGLNASLPAGTPLPATGPFEAVRAASLGLGLPLTGEPMVIDAPAGNTMTTVISGPGLSAAPIPAQLTYMPTADGRAALAWQLNVQTPDGQHWFDMSIDDTTGDIVFLSDWVDNDAYKALPLSTGTPVDGGFIVQNNPANALASPFGWHDTNGAAGAEFTDTRGNNSDAHLDRNADNLADTSPVRPSGGATLDFTAVTHDPASAPTVLANQDVAVVNLFYVTNILHDIHYQYGFTEAAGNFQVNNYGNGGLANDPLQADAQDGSGTNNANFATPVDGTSPRMQMFLYTLTTPNRDGDLDDGTITHEFGHGVSNRLTGGPGNSNALNALQSGGMGEGWGDFYGAMFLQRATDLPGDGFGHSTYTRGENRNGAGNRRFRYSYDMAIDPLTFDAYGTSGTTTYGVARSTEVHNSGELWCSALWDMNWLLCAKYGFDSNLYTGWTASPGPGHAGNKLALKLVMDAMKLQPANPSFLQARDAIIAADNALNGGADLLEIWTAFARRGLGENATTASSADTTITADFTIPATVLNLNVMSTSPAVGSVISSTPTIFMLNVNAPVNGATLDAADFAVNGVPATSFAYTPGSTSITFTFAASPVAVEGLQTMQVAAGAFTRASDANPVQAFNGTFRYDAVPMVVTSTNPTSGASTQPPLTTLDLNLNEPVLPASVTTGDLQLNLGSVAGFSLLNGNQTIRFTLSGLTSEVNLTASVAAGAFTDVNGGPNLPFSGIYSIDFTTSAFPTPLTLRSLPGSLAYDGTVSALIGLVGDSDSFTIALDAGQTLDAIVTPNSALRPVITVTGPGTNLTAAATATGAIAQLSMIPIITAGTYTLTVSGTASTAGNYSLQAVLNQASEAESVGGTTNDTTATAQSLTGAFTDLGGGTTRAAVRGRSEISPAALVNEAEPNGTTGTATPAATYYSLPNNFYQNGITGTLSSTSDADYFNIGALQVGDVLTVSESGQGSGRGTSNDPLVRLYRSGTTAIVTSDDDNGPGTDSLIHRYTIDTADTYYVRAYRFNNAAIGSWQLGIWLENSGTVPTTGATFTAEVESNETTGTADNASNAWRTLPYLATAKGSITAGDTDLYAYQFTAGDVVTLMTQSTSTLVPQSALLNSAGTALATEDGTSILNGVSGVSPIYGYVIPTTGTYYYRVTGASGSTGSYSANVYLSSAASLPLVPQGKDLYSFNLAAGQSATVALKNVTAGNLDVSLLNSGGAVVATGAAGATNADEIISNYVASNAGMYFVQVSGPPSIDYQASVVTGGTIDAEANDSFATAQLLGGGKSALGYLSSGNDDWYQFTAAIGDALTISTATPGDGAGEFVNTFNPRIEVYTPGNVLVASDDNSATDGRNALLNIVAAAAGDYRVRVSNSGSTSGEYVLRVANAVPAVLGVQINDGAAQRSRVTSITVTFSTAVTFAPGAFILTQGASTLSSIASGGILVNSALVGTQTLATLTFDSAIAGVEYGSLADGNWTLTVVAANVTATGGTPMTANYLQPNIKRLFGDFDGNGTVEGSIDFPAFGLDFYNSVPNSPFDYDGNGIVEGSIDFPAFGARFNQTL